MDLEFFTQLYRKTIFFFLSKKVVLNIGLDKYVKEYGDTGAMSVLIPH